MTVSSSTRKAGPFSGNGVTTSFPFSFKVFTSSDFQVIKTSTLGVDATLVLNTHYTVTLNPDQDNNPGGTITFPIAGALLATGEKLTVTGVLVETQGTDIQNQGGFFPQVIEDRLDYITILIQQQAEKLARVFLASASDAAPALGIGTALQRANKYPTFDTNGNVSLAQSLPSGTLSQASIGGFLYPQTPGEVAAGVTPLNIWYPPGHAKRHDAKGDGVTNDTAALQRLVASMPANGAQVYFDDGAVYMVDSLTAAGLNFSGKTNFKIFGNAATIKVLSGQSVVGGFGMVYFTNSQDGYIENLVTDANRAGRVPNGSGAFNYVIQNSCARLHFKNCRALNAVEDGFTLVTSVPGTLGTYPTDITLEDCSADNSYRVGLSIIGSLRCKVLGGSYINTNGASPQLGIDVEPDVGYTFGNTDLEIIDALVYGNTKGGITVTGPNASPNTRITIAGIRLANNGDTAIQIAQAQGVVLRDNEIGNHVGSASVGVVHVGDASGNVSDVTILNTKFRSLTSAGSANAALRVRSTVTGPVVIDGVYFNVVACPAMQLDVVSILQNVHLTSCTSTSQAINIPAARAVLRNIQIDTTTGSAMVVTGADMDLDGFTITDFGASASAGIQFEAGATGSIVRNGNFVQRTSIPAGTFAIRYNGVVPRSLRNVSAKSAGTDFTAATIFSFVSGTAGSYISDNQPDPFRVATTWNPANIANGAKDLTTVAVTGASLLDKAFAAMDSDLLGLALTADVSAANTVKVVLVNNTGAAVDIGNSNLVVWVEKR